MKIVQGWHIPKWDTHFEEYMVEGEYQKDNRNFTFEYVKDFNTVAIDVGANIGLWSRDLCKRFNHVYAFEPVKENVEYYEKNINESNYTLYNVALGKKELKNQPVYVNDNSCGASSLDSTKATHGSDIVTDVIPLDSLNLKFVGYMKIDVQGTEKEVVLGAIETLKNNDICLVVELPRNPGRKNFIEEEKYYIEVTEILANIGYNKKAQYKKEAVYIS